MSNKKTIIIHPNGIIKFFDKKGLRDKGHPSGFYRSKDLYFYKENFNVKFSS